MDLPKITIVTPSYNQADFLEETILSIIRQDYPRLEHIVMDGGSTDGSVEIIKKYAQHLTHWYSGPDDGQSDAIMKGFERGSGELMNWINSDDLLFPGALKAMAKCWQENPEADLYSGAQGYCDGEGRVTRISCPPTGAAFSLSGWMIPVGQQATFFSRDAYEKVGGLRKDFHAIMDQDLYYRILQAGGLVGKTNEPVGMIRYHEAAKTSAQRDLWHAEIPKFMQANGVSPFRHRLAKIKMRLVRMIDGSYARSMKMTRKWQGRKVFEAFDHER